MVFIGIDARLRVDDVVGAARDGEHPIERLDRAGLDDDVVALRAAHCCVAKFRECRDEAARNDGQARVVFVSISPFAPANDGFPAVSLAPDVIAVGGDVDFRFAGVAKPDLEVHDIAPAIVSEAAERDG